MKTIRPNNLRILVCLPFAVGILSLNATAQRHRTAPAPTPVRPIILAVLNDGGTVEPIGLVSKGKLVAPANGSDDEKTIAAFDKAYYKTGATYRLIFGGAEAGTVKVKAYDVKAECSRNMADVTTSSTGTKLKGLVMGLATNASGGAAATSYRRKPTTAEKSEIDALVRAEFARQKLTPKELHYQNLTAIDIERDGKAEFVGSYWIEVDKFTRGLLFFIAEKGSRGKSTLSYKDYRNVDQGSVMNGNITAVDEGVYHELLLDSFDYTGDGKAEIFTYTQGFEGAGFNAYSRRGGKWVKAYEFNNYHCGF
jgi:hypothetical protein